MPPIADATPQTVTQYLLVLADSKEHDVFTFAQRPAYGKGAVSPHVVCAFHRLCQQIMPHSFANATYQPYRFDNSSIQPPSTQPTGTDGPPPADGWRTTWQRIQRNFLRCYRGIYGPVGLYWVLPLLGAMYLHKKYGKSSPNPKVDNTVKQCPANSDGVLLFNGVRMPCVGARVE